MSTIPPAELETAFHPVMKTPIHWRVVRYEIDMNESTGLPASLVISFRSPDGAQKKLRFEEPQLNDLGSLQVPGAQHLYVADLTGLGWSSDRHIEVGEWEEERTILFWASSAQEVA